MVYHIFETYPILVPAVSGAAVGVYVSETKTLRAVVSRAAAGVFCAFAFTDITVAELGRDPATYQFGVAGLWSVTGFEAMRWLSRLDGSGLIGAIKELLPWTKGTKP